MKTKFWEGAVDEELEKSTEKFGENHSNHESYAILAEEVEEFEEEMADIRRCLDISWTLTRKNLDTGLLKALDSMSEAAEKANTELIQVGAMIKKWKNFLNSKK